MRIGILFGRGGDGTDGRKRPAQDFTEFCGLGSRVAGKERRRQAAQTQSLRSIRDRNLGYQSGSRGEEAAPWKQPLRNPCSLNI